MNMIRNVWTLNCEKGHRESFNLNQETHIFLHVPSIGYSWSMGNHRGNFNLLKGRLLFLGHICVYFTPKTWKNQVCVWGKSLF